MNHIPAHPDTPGPGCIEYSPGGYCCTRTAGHEGSHMANGDRLIAIWDNDIALEHDRYDRYHWFLPVTTVTVETEWVQQ